MATKQIGQIIKLKPEAYEEYKRLHADVWPEVLEAIYKANIRNYSIYYWNGFLFAHMEYIGDDYDADMAAIAADPKTREWWQLTDPLQQPVQGSSSSSVEGDWWTNMENLVPHGLTPQPACNYRCVPGSTRRCGFASRPASSTNAGRLPLDFHIM